MSVAEFSFLNNNDNVVASLVYLYQTDMSGQQIIDVHDRSIISNIVENFLGKRQIITEKQIDFMRYKLRAYMPQLMKAPINNIPKYSVVKNSQAKKISPISMPLEATKLGSDIKIKFAYSADMVAKIKAIPNAIFESKNNEKYWLVPDTPSNTKYLSQLGFPIEVTKTKQKQICFDGLKKELRPYQKEGATKIASDFNMRALLADEMGLGKTCQALASVWAKRDIAFPVLVICPASLKLNWEKEILQWLPDVSVRVLFGYPERDQFLVRDKNEITVVNQELLADKEGKNAHVGWAKLFSYTKYQTMIIDECHSIKNPKSKRTQAILELSKTIPYKIAMSGTPIESRPVEFYPTLKAINPRIFPNEWLYKVRYCGMRRNQWGCTFDGATNTVELNDILTTTCMIRRHKKDVLQDLPQKVTSIIPVDINMFDYKRAESALLSWIQDQSTDKSTGGKVIKDTALAYIERCKQACIRGKFPAISDFIDNFLESGKKLVIFATHVFTLDHLQNSYKNISVRLDGKVHTQARQQIVEQFQEDDNIKLFLGNLKAAGTGITLTAASDTLTVELGWTPGIHEQACDRVHRIGQKSSVVNYFIIAKNTIEEKIIDLLTQKQKALSEVLDGKELEQRDSLLSLLLTAIGGTLTK